MIQTAFGPAWRRGPGDVVAVTADAGYHCPPCAMERYGALDGLDSEGNALWPVYSMDLHECVSCDDCHGEIYCAEG